MANVPTYPGVYIEEVSSGVHTIIGVQTSIAAFVGPTKYGPIDEPRVIHSYADFERTYGGLWINSPVSFAVRDFFTNGGSTAVIARIYRAPAGGDGKAVVDLDGKLKLEARDPGKWGEDLRVSVVNVVTTKNAKGGDDVVYDLVVALAHENRVEYMTVHRGLSSDPKSKRRVDQVLEKESDMVRVKGALPDVPTPPTATAAPAKNTALFDDENKGKAFYQGEGGSDSDLVKSEDILGSQSAHTGLYLLDRADLFNLLCIPPTVLGGTLDATVIDDAIAYCKLRRAVLLIDPPADWNSKEKAIAGLGNQVGSPSENAAIYFPRLRQPNPLNGDMLEDFVPCGAVAGIIAATDAARGVWKAPAGSDAVLLGVPELTVKMNDLENGELNPLGINCLRSFADRGRVVWGARTRKGNDQLTSEYKYLPIRRLALFLEESLFRGSQWVVFEPNDEPLWSQIRLNLGAFMHGMFRQGAFQGSSPKDAYFVKCDADTTPQEDRDAGIVNIIVGFAPLKPAEFVIIKFQQIAGQLAI